MRALLELWGELAADKPALIVFEDVHWLDPTSLEPSAVPSIRPLSARAVAGNGKARNAARPGPIIGTSPAFRYAVSAKTRAKRWPHSGQDPPQPGSAAAHGIGTGNTVRTWAAATPLLGQYYFAIGAFLEASRQFRQALAIFAETPEDLSTLGAFGSQRVVCLSLLAGVHFALDEIALARPSHPNAGWSGCRPEQSRSRRRFLQSTRAEEISRCGRTLPREL